MIDTGVQYSVYTGGIPRIDGDADRRARCVTGERAGEVGPLIDGVENRGGRREKTQRDVKVIHGEGGRRDCGAGSCESGEETR